MKLEEVMSVVPDDSAKEKIRQYESLRQAEKAKLASELEEQRKARSDLEARLQAVEEQRKAAEFAKLEPDAQIKHRISELQSEYRKTQEQIERERLFFNNKIRGLELVAYRERALRDAGEDVIPELVQGQDEEEIDRALDASRSAYRRMQQQFESKYGKKVEGSAPVESQMVPLAASAPPPNPAYVAQMPTAYQGGLPTLANPPPVTEGGPSNLPFNIKDMTSEDAVRSGKYSGEIRDTLHRMMRGANGYTTDPRTNARHMMQYAPQPMGVMQPVGTPITAAPPVNYAMPQAAPQAQPQAVQYTPQAQAPAPMPQGQMSPQAMAQAAIARTHQGANPVMSQNPGAQTALSDAQATAGRTGMTPQQAFSGRFSQ